MDELGTYKQQLEQIELALVDDPENAELQKLKTDLTELIDLMAMATGGARGKGEASSSSSSKGDKRRRAAAADAAPGRSPVAAGLPASPCAAGGAALEEEPTQPAHTPPGPAPTREWKVGEECKARWAQDGRFYDALITAASDTGVFSVTFTEYGDVALLGAHELRPLQGNGAAASSSARHKRRASAEDSGSVGIKASADPAGSGAAGGSAGRQKAKKKKDGGKSEVVEKQDAWLSFAKKGPKAPRGKKASLISKRSMFSTPDNPNAKY